MAHILVRGVPDWVPHERLLDDGPWTREGADWSAERPLPVATAIGERLRNLGMGGHAFEVEIRPRPKRNLVRKVRLDAARRRRRGESGFLDKRAKLDADGRMFLTSERLAMLLARRAKVRSVVDATAGCGGNAIAFARAGMQVTAIEKDAHRLDLARHNARVYGVASRIRFLSGDARELLPHQDAELCFVDPPWGEVDRTRCTEVPLLEDLLPLLEAFDRAWVKVPPSFAPVPTGFRPEAWFGQGEGDRQTVKFVLLRRD